MESSLIISIVSIIVDILLAIIIYKLSNKVNNLIIKMKHIGNYNLDNDEMTQIQMRPNQESEFREVIIENYSKFYYDEYALQEFMYKKQRHLINKKGFSCFRINEDGNIISIFTKGSDSENISMYESVSIFEILPPEITITKIKLSEMTVFWEGKNKTTFRNECYDDENKRIFTNITKPYENDTIYCLVFELRNKNSPNEWLCDKNRIPRYKKMIIHLTFTSPKGKKLYYNLYLIIHKTQEGSYYLLSNQKRIFYIVAKTKKLKRFILKKFRHIIGYS